MEKYTYLLINFLTVIICFIFSFHPKIKFNKHFLPFLKASALVGVVFILWDAFFTDYGVWWFNDRYVIGWRIFGLPLEEWLFFICIPFACIYTYFCLNLFFNLNWVKKYEKVFFGTSIVICLIVASVHTDKIYTCVTFATTGLTILYVKYIAKVRWLGKISLVYTILLLPFFMVNGVLTGTGLEQPIVNYNDGHYLALRILTVPIEDAVYGYEMIVWNLFFFYKFSKTTFKNE
ncbi:MAG: lycopene cyclase domain-containing protein [Flavobacterium sp.]|nr:lycopene cyclase domain-containing protein [Candidatus Neoflavobacterium equi]